MSVTRVHAALLLVLAAALGGLLWSRQGPSAGPAIARTNERAVGLLLPDAALLVTVDVSALAESSWGRSVLASIVALAGSPSDPGCAERQLRTVQTLGVALPFAPPESSAVELGLVAEGPFEARDVMACATALMTKRGGVPASSQVNEFSVLRDRRDSGGELAVKDGGPLIVSGGDYFRDLLEREGGALRDERGVSEKLHRALRARAGPAPILATWVLPPGWLERWLADDELGRSPLGSIRAVVVRGTAGKQLALRVQLSTENAAAAEALEPFIQRFAGGASAFLSGGAARAPSVARQRETIVVELTSEGFDLRRLLWAMKTFEGGGARPSHTFDGPNAEQVQPGAERASGGRAQ